MAETTEQGPIPETTSADYQRLVVIPVIDGMLAKLSQRELVSTGEATDMLLDTRTLVKDLGGFATESN